MLNIVLFQPEIPQNTGNIGRVCVCNDLHLHLIKPLGFEISDKQLKRSGLDYWKNLKLTVHDDWESFLSSIPPERRLWMLTTKAKQIHWQAKFLQNDYLVFGPETKGLPLELIQNNIDRCLKIPMLSKENARSLNLSTSVGIVTYEALRQIS
jgi:tRNA (cytidine/uridine-2'-O-)-methyltransferase